MLKELHEEGIIAKASPLLLKPFTVGMRHTDPALLRAAWEGRSRHDLSGLSGSLVCKLLHGASCFDVPAEELVMVQGFTGSDLMLVVDGEVALEVEGRVVERRGPGRLVGVASCLDPASRRHATVRTATASRLLTLRGSAIRRVSRGRGQRELARCLAKRRRGASTRSAVAWDGAV